MNATRSKGQPFKRTFQKRFNCLLDLVRIHLESVYIEAPYKLKLSSGFEFSLENSALLNKRIDLSY